MRTLSLRSAGETSRWKTSRWKTTRRYRWRRGRGWIKRAMIEYALSARYSMLPPKGISRRCGEGRTRRRRRWWRGTGIHLRKQTSAAIYRMSEKIPAAHIPIEPFKGPPSVWTWGRLVEAGLARGGRGGGFAMARGWRRRVRVEKTKRAQQKHNFPRWRSEECSRNEWSFPSVPLALFSSSDRMFVFRKIDRNETPAVSSRV